MGEQSSLNYHDKLGDNLALTSTKTGQAEQYGGCGRGLAEASGVIANYDGSIICSNRVGKESGAHIEFRSSLTLVTSSDIDADFIWQKQIFSSPFAQNNIQQESEELVGALLSNLTLFKIPKQTGSDVNGKSSTPSNGTF